MFRPAAGRQEGGLNASGRSPPSVLTNQPPGRMPG